MNGGRRARAPRRWLPLAAAACVWLAVPGFACELVLAGSRSGRELARLPLQASAPAARIAFTHSVLGTGVTDHYSWRFDDGQWRAHLVEERFEGQGYGLPHAAGPGETLTREGDIWRLRLDRVVHPLLVLPLPALGMRVLIEGRAPLLLGTLATTGGESISLRAQACSNP